jgi:hypothetical protein
MFRLAFLVMDLILCLAFLRLVFLDLRLVFLDLALPLATAVNSCRQAGE